MQLPCNGTSCLVLSSKKITEKLQPPICATPRQNAEFDAKFDYSVTIRGTTLGYVITFIGPFEKRSIAEDLLPKVKTCIPEAYIKQVVFDD